MIPNINEASRDTAVLCLEYEKVKSYSDLFFKFEKKAHKSVWLDSTK